MDGIRINSNPGLLNSGDLVTTDYGSPFSKSSSTYSGNIVRRITGIGRDKRCNSGFWASANGGETCPTCGNAPAVSTGRIDASWFIPVTHEKNQDD